MSVLPVDRDQQEIADALIAGTRRAARGRDDRQAVPSNARRHPNAVGDDALGQRRVLADLHIVPQNRPDETGRRRDRRARPDERRRQRQRCLGRAARERQRRGQVVGRRADVGERRVDRRRLERCRGAPGSAPGRASPTDSAGSSSGQAGERLALGHLDADEVPGRPARSRGRRTRSPRRRSSTSTPP